MLKNVYIMSVGGQEKTEMSPCHLVLSTHRVPATVLTIRLQCFLSAVTSLSSASFIPVTSCISSIYFLLGRLLLLLPSPCASIILFSSPSDRITCPKNRFYYLLLPFITLLLHYALEKNVLR